MQSISVTERRTRLARRHHLAPVEAAADSTRLAEQLVGLHATDPATVFLSARARVSDLTVTDLETALYDDQTLTKHLGMRRTLFVLPTSLLPVVQAACTNAIVAAERRRLARDVERGGIATSGGRWLRRAERATLEGLESLCNATGAQLSRAVPELKAKLIYGEGKAWGGEVGVAGRVFTILEAEGRIRRGRPSGSWTSSQHRWTLATEPPAAMDEAAAQAELVRRWLAAFGPATVQDVTWWTGLGVGKIRAALAAIGGVDVDLEGEPGVILADDLDPSPPVDPWAALLPALDPTVMGWKRRNWYLGGHEAELYDRNGNAGPTVWWDGRAVGGWTQRRSGEIVTYLLEDAGSGAAAAIEIEASRLEAWLGETKVTPRFATPLEQTLRR